MPRLVIFDDSLRAVDLPEQPLIVGRSSKSDIPISDRLLSRKHCAIVPGESGFRIVDLKSAHGTFLNGSRVERHELRFDDVIEVGSTVMVFLDTEAWSRGEGLAKLRNPVKAQELVQRINLHAKKKESIPVDRITRGKLASGTRRNVIDMLPVLMESQGPGRDGPVIQDEMLELLVDFAAFKAIDLWVRRRPDMKRLLAKSVETALFDSLSGSWEDFRAQLRRHLERGLAGVNGGSAHGDPMPSLERESGEGERGGCSPAGGGEAESSGERPESMARHEATGAPDDPSGA